MNRNEAIEKALALPVERIVAAAVRGKSYFGAEALRRMNADHVRVGPIDDARFAECPPEPLEQGFVTSTGRFVDREEAWRIAKAAGQVTPRLGQQLAGSAELFSEDLW